MIFQRGIKPVSIDDLAKEMKISKKTVYQYFKSKEEIIDKLLKKHLNEHKEIIEKIHEESEDVIKEILLIMQCSSHMLTQIHPQLFDDLRAQYKKTWQKFQQFKQDFIIDRIAKILEKGQKQGLIRKNISIQLMAHLRLKEIELLMDYQFVKMFNLSIHDMQRAITEYFIYSVGTQKGIEKMQYYFTHPDKLNFNYTC